MKGCGGGGGGQATASYSMQWCVVCALWPHSTRCCPPRDVLSPVYRAPFLRLNFTHYVRKTRIVALHTCILPHRRSAARKEGSFCWLPPSEFHSGVGHTHTQRLRGVSERRSVPHRQDIAGQGNVLLALSSAPTRSLVHKNACCHLHTAQAWAATPLSQRFVQGTVARLDRGGAIQHSCTRTGLRGACVLVHFGADAMGVRTMRLSGLV